MGLLGCRAAKLCELWASVGRVGYMMCEPGVCILPGTYLHRVCVCVRGCGGSGGKDVYRMCEYILCAVWAGHVVGRVMRGPCLCTVR